MTVINQLIMNDQGTVAGGFPYHVLTGPPISRTVPIIGLAGNANRPDHELWSVSERDDAKIIDRQALGRLRKGSFGPHCYLTTRHKVGPREARYAHWLAFKDQAGATAFLAEFPRYGLSNLIADAERRIAIIQHDLKQGMEKGRYDLAELGEEVRYRKAKLYVDSIDNVRQLENSLSKLEYLNRFSLNSG